MDDDEFSPEDPLIAVGRIIGELDSMCSPEEVAMRTETRQVDKFEIASGGYSISNLMVDPSKCLKKYQRSSADKKYIPSEIRTVNACWKSMEYLLEKILDFDVNPKTGFSDACYQSNYFDIYSFMRDRLRSIRVDLHVQNCPTDLVFIRVHEYCLRFELLSLYLLWGRQFGGSGGDRKFDLHMSLTALSQTIDPLTNAYVKRRRQMELSSSPLDAVVAEEAEITRYILLLSLTSRAGSKQFKSHYLKQPKEIQNHPLVKEAFSVCCDYYAGFNERFLTRISTFDDLLSMCAVLPVLNIVRTRALWRMVRTNRPFFIRRGGLAAGAMPPPRPEKILMDENFLSRFAFKDISDISEFLKFHGLIATADHVVMIPPRQLAKNPYKWWMSSREWRERASDDRDFQDFEWEEKMAENFESRIGSDSDRFPDRSEYPHRIERVLVDKFLSLSKSRKAIVTGGTQTSIPTKKVLMSYPTFSVEPEMMLVAAPVAPRSTHPFSKGSPKDRPIVAIEPLSARITVAKNFIPQEDHTKRPREPSTTPSPSQQSVIRPKVETTMVAPVQSMIPVATTPLTAAPSKSLSVAAVAVEMSKPIWSAPPLPTVPSPFDILANELFEISISPPLANIMAIAEPEEEITSAHGIQFNQEINEGLELMREVDMGTKRTKFFALKSLIAWRSIVQENRRFKKLLANQNPIRL